MRQQILIGDVRQRLSELPDSSVHCCITSPPYFGLRDYGTAQWDGGDPACDHVDRAASNAKNRLAGAHSGDLRNKTDAPQTSGDRATVQHSHACPCGATRIDSQIGMEPTLAAYIATLVDVFREVRRVLRPDGVCWIVIGDSYCSHDPGGHRDGEFLNPGGRQSEESRGTRNKAGTFARGQNGLKPKDLMMVPARVAIALVDDGWWLRSEIVWSKPNPMPESVRDRCTSAHEKIYMFSKGEWKSRVVQFANLPCQRFHFSQYFRPDSLPVSGAARLPVDLATAIFDCAQSENDFGLPPFYAEVWKQLPDGSDSELVRRLPEVHRSVVWAARFLNAEITAEQFLGELHRMWVAHADNDDLLERWALASSVADAPSITSDGKGAITVHYPGEICKVDFALHRAIITRPRHIPYYYDADAIREPATGHEQGTKGVGEWNKLPTETTNGRGASTLHQIDPAGRNRRNVWTIPTSPLKAAHFATFPPKLVEPMILAGTSQRGACSNCGSPWVRQVERTRVLAGNSAKAGRSPDEINGSGKWAGHQNGNVNLKSGPTVETETTGWSPGCACAAEVVPCTILDPFSGAGTTGVVAARLGRSYVGIELNPEYAEMSRRRIDGDAPMFNSVSIVPASYDTTGTDQPSSPDRSPLLPSEMLETA